MGRYLGSVANATIFSKGLLRFDSTTMLDTTLTQAVEQLLIRGGYGNKVLSAINHTSSLELAFTDTQWSLEAMGLNTGVDSSIGGKILASETVTITNNTATLVGTPIAVVGSSVYAYTTYQGTYLNLNVTGQTITTTNIPTGTILCVKYLIAEQWASKIVIPSNIVPEIGDVYLTAQLFGDSDGRGAIGSVTINIPSFKFNGTQDISMTADGASTTALSGIALESQGTGCGEGVYAIITETLFATSDYSTVVELAIEGNDFGLTVPNTKTLQVWGKMNNVLQVIPNSAITFTSSEGAKATVGGTTGIVTAVSAGASQITATITANTSVSTQVTVTVT